MDAVNLKPVSTMEALKTGLMHPWPFLLSLAVLLQQLCVAASTYLTGKAGEALEAGNRERIVPLVLLFFLVVGINYLFGMMALCILPKFTRSTFCCYYQTTLQKYHKHLPKPESKERWKTWINGEALPACDALSSKTYDLLSIYLNVFLNLSVVFYFLEEIASILVLCTLLSVTLMLCSQSYLQIMTEQRQTQKVTMLQKINALWDPIFFGAEGTQEGVKQEAKQTTALYFNHLTRYILLETLLTSLPILCSIALLAFRFRYAQPHSYGGILGVLPRILQIFQQMHALNLCSVTMVMQVKRLKNLLDFPKSLFYSQEANEAKIAWELLTVFQRLGKTEQPVKLSCVKQWIAHPPSEGRWQIRGPNGAGKTTLLRAIKANASYAALLGPDIQLYPSNGRSTGQLLQAQLQALLCSKTKVLLLDEWDAHLDACNRKAISKMLETFSKDRSVIEVIHRAEEEGASEVPGP